jgi:ABC-2 type transport system ATP-binding protein
VHRAAVIAPGRVASQVDSSSPEAPALSLRAVTKSYPTGHLGRARTRVLGPLDLDVRRGEILGFLGANGAGKTTTLKVVLGLVHHDGGTIEVLGVPHDRMSWRSQIGYLPEQPYFYDYLTGAEFLRYIGSLFGLGRRERDERAQVLLKKVGLADAAGMPLRRFSKGMLQRIGLAQALVNDPDFLLLDEPMSGLDPLGRRLVRNIILEERARGRTVLFSTHILSDAETLCDRVALLKAGRLVGVGRLDEILGVDVSHMEVLASGVPDDLIAALGIAAVRTGERCRLEVEEGALGSVLERLVARGVRILTVQPVRQSLEELFLREAGSSPGADA